MVTEQHQEWTVQYHTHQFDLVPTPDQRTTSVVRVLTLRLWLGQPHRLVAGQLGKCFIRKVVLPGAFHQTNGGWGYYYDAVPDRWIAEQVASALAKANAKRDEIVAQAS